MCVCVYERVGEREREWVCVCARAWERERERETRVYDIPLSSGFSIVSLTNFCVRALPASVRQCVRPTQHRSKFLGRVVKPLDLNKGGNYKKIQIFVNYVMYFAY
jgi:hypothetical protein